MRSAEVSAGSEKYDMSTAYSHLSIYVPLSIRIHKTVPNPICLAYNKMQM